MAHSTFLQCIYFQSVFCLLRAEEVKLLFTCVRMCWKKKVKRQNMEVDRVRWPGIDM